VIMIPVRCTPYAASAMTAAIARPNPPYTARTSELGRGLCECDSERAHHRRRCGKRVDAHAEEEQPDHDDDCDGHGSLLTIR
jgi:hypothetical protein